MSGQFILAFFTDKGVPKTGLSPTLKIWDVATTTLLVNGDSMSEVDGGFYKYFFTTFNGSKNYAILCDGGASLKNTERFTVADNGTESEDIRKALWNKLQLKRVSKTKVIETMYDNDGTTVIRTQELTQDDRNTETRTPA